MQDFEKRMFVELTDLDGRLINLQRAMTTGGDSFKEKVGEKQYELLKKQMEGMIIYRDALVERAKDLKLMHKLTDEDE